MANQLGNLLLSSTPGETLSTAAHRELRVGGIYLLFQLVCFEGKQKCL